MGPDHQGSPGTPKDPWPSHHEKIAPMADDDDQMVAGEPTSEYSLLVRDHGGARQILEATGALAEIENAVLAHARATAPTPTYEPQAIKRLLAQHDWVPEARVPPYDEQYDDFPINDRYDLYKVFTHSGARVGIAIEMEKWEVWNDLLKFRRGLHRGQIAAGVLIHDNPQNLTYVFEHLRLVSEPLFGDLAILFAAPSGVGLPAPKSPSKKQYQPYLMPES